MGLPRCSWAVFDGRVLKGDGVRFIFGYVEERARVSCCRAQDVEERAANQVPCYLTMCIIYN